MWAAFSAAGIGFPVLSGYLMNTNYRILFQVAAGVQGLNLIYVIFLVPEVRPTSLHPFTWWEIFPLYPFRILKGNYFVIWILVLSFFVSWASTAFEILSLWCHYMWGWDALQMGIASTIIHVIALLQVPINRFIFPHFKDSYIIPAGILCLLACSLSYVFMRTFYIMIIAASLNTLGHSINPVIQGLASVQYDEKLQGDFGGVFAAVRGLVWCIGPLMNGYLWAAFIRLDEQHRFPAINFSVSAGILFLSFVGSIVLFCFYRVQEKDKIEDDPVELTIQDDKSPIIPKSPSIERRTPTLKVATPVLRSPRVVRAPGTPILGFTPLPEGF